MFRLHPWLEIRRDGDIRILVDNRSGSITSCNPTAWAVLEELNRGATRNGLISRVLGEFDVSRERAVEDVDWFFSHLSALGYIEESA